MVVLSLLLALSGACSSHAEPPIVIGFDATADAGSDVESPPEMGDRDVSDRDLPDAPSEPPKLTEFRERVESRRATLGVPGLGVAVVVDGRLALAEGFGEREIGGEPVSPDTLFVVGSVTKPVVASAILELAELGRLDLDTPVAELIDDFAAQPPEHAAAVTTRHFLTHTSGYPNYPQTFWSTDVDLNSANALDLYLMTHGAEHVLEFPPGRLHLYSNFGYGLLGWILERVEQAPFDDVLKALVLEPYGMPTSTTTYVTSGDFAVPHSNQGRGLVSVGNYALSPAQAPFASLRTSPTELGAYMERLLNSDAEHAIAQMFERAVGASPRGSEQFTLGLYEVRLEDGRSAFYHTGSAWGWTAKILLVPESGFAVAAMANSDHSSVVFDVPSIALDLFESTAEGADELDAAPLQQYIGTYDTEDYGLVEIAVDGNTLSITYVDSGATRRLTHWTDDQFVLGFPGGLDPSIPSDTSVLATFWPADDGLSTDYVTSPFGAWSVVR